MTVRIPNLTDETLAEPAAERTRRKHAEILRALTKAVELLDADVSDLTGSIIGGWAVITASADQATIDESVPDLVTAFDTVSDGSASHGVTVSAGIVTLPVNTSGYQWEVHAQVALLHSALGTAQFRFYSLPASTNTAIGLTGFETSATNTNHASSAIGALAWLTGATTVGLRCTSTTGVNTVTLEYEWSRIICREVKA